MKGMMKVKLVIALLVVIAVAIFYYVSLPAINIHATENLEIYFSDFGGAFRALYCKKGKDSRTKQD